MKRFFAVCMTTIAMTSPAMAAGLKIGVVNLQRAVAETHEGKRAEAKLKKLKDKLEKDLNGKLKKFYAREKKLREAWSILKEGERKKRADSSRKEMERLQQEYMKSERQLMERKTNEMLKISRRINKIIQKIAKREKYDYIFTNAAVLWAPSYVDLTNQVINACNSGK